MQQFVSSKHDDCEALKLTRWQRLSKFFDAMDPKNNINIIIICEPCGPVENFIRRVLLGCSG